MQVALQCVEDLTSAIHPELFVTQPHHLSKMETMANRKTSSEYSTVGTNIFIEHGIFIAHFWLFFFNLIR